MALGPATSLCSPTSGAAVALANATDLCFAYCDCESVKHCARAAVDSVQRRELQSLYGAFSHLYAHLDSTERAAIEC